MTAHVFSHVMLVLFFSPYKTQIKFQQASNTEKEKRFYESNDHDAYDDGKEFPRKSKLAQGKLTLSNRETSDEKRIRCFWL